jgi:hypothetical protein
MRGGYGESKRERSSNEPEALADDTRYSVKDGEAGIGWRPRLRKMRKKSRV